MKKILMSFFVILLCAGAVAAREYDLNERESVDLSGVNEIIFDLDGLNCALCVNAVSIDNYFSGEHPGNKLELRLEGRIDSNQQKAVPSITMEKRGRSLTVSLYKETGLIFGLVQRGQADFSVDVPASFQGRFVVKVSSGNIDAENLSTQAIELHASSGDISFQDLQAENIVVTSSSGRISGQGLNAGDELNIKASSGRMNLAGLEADTVNLHSSSGDINIDGLVSGYSEIKISSGRLTIQDGSGEIHYRGSSGATNVSMSELTGDLDLSSSSGNISLTLPRRSSFDADLHVSSGRISSDFQIIGDVSKSDEDTVSGKANGGGHDVKIRASSGNISIKEQ